MPLQALVSANVRYGGRFLCLYADTPSTCCNIIVCLYATRAVVGKLRPGGHKWPEDPSNLACRAVTKKNLKKAYEEGVSLIGWKKVHIPPPPPTLSLL